MRTYIKLAAAAAVAVTSVGVFLYAGPGSEKLAAPDTAARKWAASNGMIEARAGACAVALSDGRILVTGGSNDNGALASAEFLRLGDSSLQAAPMHFGRTGHMCVALNDDSVLVAGGNDSSGAAISAAELFDAAKGSWNVIGSMSSARHKASATLLRDGRVLIAGGEASQVPIQTLEIFDPYDTAFHAVAGLMSAPRKSHAAALLNDGRVVIAGGSNGEAPLDSIDIFDPSTGAVSQFATMSTSREGLSATTLLDGRVLLAGGNNGEVELASMEALDFAKAATQLVSGMESARRDHLAVRVPNNNTVLMIGGTSAGKPLATSGRYIPWRDTYELLAPSDSERAEATTAALKSSGTVLLAGGSSRLAAATSSTFYAESPTIRTDKLDYAPGMYVSISGMGWTPGSTVNLVVKVQGTSTVRWQTGVAPLSAPPVADSNGNITVSNAFLVETSDLGVTFELTASSSTQTAQVWVFTDNAITVENVCVNAICSQGAGGTSGLGSNAGASVSITGGSNFSLTADIKHTGGDTGTASATITLPPGFNLAGGEVATKPTITLTGAGQVTLTWNLSAPVGANPAQPVFVNLISPSGHNTLDTPRKIQVATSGPSNSAPVINSNSGSITVNEGQTASNSGTWTDSNAGDNVILSASVGSVTKGETNAAGTWSWSYSTTDGPTQSQTVTITANDGTTTSSTTFSLTVTNVVPIVSAGADATIQEGGTFSQAGSFSDPGADTWTATVDYGDGSGIQTLPLTGKTFNLSHLYADNGSYTVTVTVTDDDAGAGTDTVIVTVTNVAPTVNAGADATVQEGTTFSQAGAFTDPGSDTWSATVNYGDGSGSQPLALGAGKTFNLSHTYADNGSYTVTVTVTDDDGGSGIDTVLVTVNNVAPAVTFTNGPTSVTESGVLQVTYQFSVSDVAADTYTGTAACGTGGTLVVGSLSVTGNSGSQTGSFKCVFPDGPANSAVSVQFTDDDSGVGSDTRLVIVNNVAPTATFNAPALVNEGSSINISLTNPSDPSTPDTTAGFSYAFDCGTGAGYGVFSTTSTASCATNDNGLRNVAGKIRDKDGGETVYPVTVSVVNVAPTVTIAGPAGPLALVTGGTAVTVTANYTDPGTNDTHACSWTWDDLNSTAPASTNGVGSGTGSCSATHVFTNPGVYTVAVTVSDDDGGSGSATFQYVVIYDPSAGFVTGGGWVNVPAGSYVPNGGLSGKGTFGFVSKYKKGATAPEGNTEFQFHAAGMNFNSTNYQWLVVSGAKAQFKGTGTINGTGSYGFLLTATDGQVNGGGGVDKFRIKITDLNNGGAVVFDNVLGGTDDIDAASPQAISGGSIVIHAK